MEPRRLKDEEPSCGHDCPRLSVVIASDHSTLEMEQILKVLLPQRPDQKIEIIVADSRADDSVQEVMTKYPEVAFSCFPEKTPLPMLWGWDRTFARRDHCDH